MVLKNFIHYLINKYLKNYIERLDYEKLNFSLRNGHVLLENLRLKPEALVSIKLFSSSNLSESIPRLI